MKTPISYFLAPILSILVSLNAHGSLLNELSPKDKIAVTQGKEVIITKEIGKTWPEISIYQKVNASPETIKNLFLDYENAHTYIPSLKKAVIENSPSKDTKDIRYTVKLPVILSISYLVRNKYEKTELGHKISWNLLESSIANSAQGSLRIETINDNKSIICYRTHIEPATRLVAKLRGNTIKEASTTVDAIVKKAEYLQNNYP